MIVHELLLVYYNSNSRRTKPHVQVQVHEFDSVENCSNKIVTFQLEQKQLITEQTN